MDQKVGSWQNKRFGFVRNKQSEPDSGLGKYEFSRMDVFIIYQVVKVYLGISGLKV